MIEAPLVVAGYLCGSLPFGYWLVRWFRGTDIRSVGSGNSKEARMDQRAQELHLGSQPFAQPGVAG